MEDEQKSLQILERESQKGWWLEDKSQIKEQIALRNLDPTFLENELTEKEQEMRKSKIGYLPIVKWRRERLSQVQRIQ
jgi:hypothetical protein